MQLTSDLRITRDGKVYDLEPSALLINSRTSIEVDNQKFYFVPVEEALLIKVILGRGPEMGKSDIEDVKKFLGLHPHINFEYMNQRQLELGLPVDFFAKSLR